MEARCQNAGCEEAVKVIDFSGSGAGDATEGGSQNDKENPRGRDRRLSGVKGGAKGGVEGGVSGGVTGGGKRRLSARGSHGTRGSSGTPGTPGQRGGLPHQRLGTPKKDCTVGGWSMRAWLGVEHTKMQAISPQIAHPYKHHG